VLHLQVYLAAAAAEVDLMVVRVKVHENVLEMEDGEVKKHVWEKMDGKSPHRGDVSNHGRPCGDRLVEMGGNVCLDRRVEKGGNVCLDRTTGLEKENVVFLEGAGSFYLQEDVGVRHLCHDTGAKLRVPLVADRHCTRDVEG
jgi:hypothetical protein